MPQPLRSGPDPSEPVPSDLEVLHSPLEDTPFETDFAPLTACFASQSEQDPPLDLFHNLTFEIVLNEIVEQACLTTGATGAAIALPRNGEMVCRAISGSTAPELGSRLDADSGLARE